MRGGPAAGARRKPEPDWASLHRELRRPGVTLMLLWQEYRASAPEGYGYSRFCELYEAWESRLSPIMRQVHPAGERLFVDYAGQTVELVDGRTGEVRTAQIFVAVLGASSYTYAEASWTQTLPDWIGAHVRALAFFGGVPRQIVPDNLKAGVLKANWYEPGLNPTYQDLASHYGTAILPARPRRPRDKAKVEVGVQVVERWILARLRNQRFFSLAELNSAIADAARRPQRPADAPPRRQPAPAVRRARPAGARRLAGRALRLRRVAPAPRRARLPRRHRRPLLLGAAPPAAPAARGAHHRAHRRAVPQGRACRLSSAAAAPAAATPP